MDNDHAARQTVADFGEQWTTYTENDGYYASQEMFGDIVSPLFAPTDFRGKRCAEVGAGSGRISQMLLRAGAAHVTAIEPSKASDVLAQNLSEYGERVTVVAASGEEFAVNGLDFILSIGVLHHIPDPSATVRNMHRSLAEGGQAIVWLYGKEGNWAYLVFAEPLRWLTRRLPLVANQVFAAALYPLLAFYIWMCRYLPLPMRKYMREVLQPIGGKAIRLVIVDQLNPQWAKYYNRAQAQALLADAGFQRIRLHHRHGYSWTVTGFR